jgi:hypothetical protein
MVRRIALLCFFLSLSVLSSLTVLGQQAHFTTVDREEVRKAVTDSLAPTWYPKLVDRFNAFDTSLTRDEYRLLYYGFVFQRGYSAFPNQKKKEIVKAINDKDFDRSSDISDSVLDECPVSLTGNYYKGLSLFYGYPDRTDYAQYRSRFVQLVDAILSSGDGLTAKTAFKTIFVADEYQIIYTHFKIEQFISQSLVGQCDLLTIKPSAAWPHKEIYFDTSESLRKETELFGK